MTTTMRIYAEYKFVQLRRMLRKSALSLRTMRVWWEIYMAFFIASVVLHYLTGFDRWLWLSFGSFIFMVFISFVIDYRNGGHVHYMRMKREKEWKQKKEGQESLSA